MTVKQQMPSTTLLELHGICDLNYLRLVRVFPDMRMSRRRVFRAEGVRSRHASLTVVVEVVDISPYTTSLIVSGGMDSLKFMGRQSLNVKIYHDAKMAEVTHCDEKPLRFLRYMYPNRNMFQANEKNLMNQFLGLWLEQILQSGHTVDTDTL